jgi:nitronate monooxygenase
MRNDIERVRMLTGKAFGVNLFIDAPAPPIDDRELKLADRRLDAYRDELRIPHRESPPLPPAYHDEQMQVVLETRPRAFSFTLGIPPAAVIADLKSAGIFTIGTATTVEEAVALEEAGIEAICAQGAEAGGHRGTFLGGDALPLIGTMALVPQVVDAVAAPVIAAGGIGDGRGIAAVLALGACAAQLGTSFLRAREAATAAAFRDVVASASSSNTVITEAFSGKPARGIANLMTRELSNPAERAPYPYQNTLTRDIRNAGAAQGHAEFLSLFAGQAFPLAREAPAAEIVETLLAQMRASLQSAASALE